MVFISCVFVLWVYYVSIIFGSEHIILYTYKLNKYSYNILIGFYGLACVFELPNSFISEELV